MSIESDIEKAKVTEQRLVNKLNQEEGWIEKHPGWVTIGIVVLVLGFIVMAVRGCHHP